MVRTRCQSTYELTSTLDVAYMKAVNYRAADGTEPVDDFINDLSDKIQAALDLQIDRLNLLRSNDPLLPYPHSSDVTGNLRELRCHYGKTLYRILYAPSGSLFVLLHIFRKDTQKIPRSEITVALTRWNDFQYRMNSAPRRPPRAAGHDAP